MSWVDILKNNEKYKKAVESYQPIHDKELRITANPIYSEHEYTLISQADETVFAEDETGAPHVFTIDEWNAIKGKKNDGTGFLLIAAITAGLMIL